MTADPLLDVLARISLAVAGRQAAEEQRQAAKPPAIVAREVPPPRLAVAQRRP